MAFLRRRVAYLFDDVGELRSDMGEVRRDLIPQVSDVAVESRQTDAVRTKRVSQVATGSARQELLGLVLVGVGSIVTALG
jgi:hypothetical protein